MKFGIVSFQRRASSWADEAAEHYLKRVRRWRPVEVTRLKPTAFRGDEDAVRRDEAVRLKKQLGPRDLLVALDERGQDWSTADLAAFIERTQHGGHTRLVFALGGPYGHDQQVRDRAQQVVRLSALTLNHEIAGVVLAEAIYRAMAVIRGDPYHH